jgi:probable multidrug resistance protein norM (multidrug-effluxtransporter)
VAAHQIVGNTTSFIYQAPLSLGIAVSVLVAQCLGAGSPTLARQAMIRVLRFALGIAAVTCSCLFLFRHTVVSLFTTDPAVALLAESLLGIAVIFHVADALQTISCFALRGYRVTFLPMCIYGVLLWSVGLGGGCWLGFHAESFGGPFGAHGFWAATAAGIILVSIAISTYAFYIAKDRLKDERVARTCL